MSIIARTLRLSPFFSPLVYRTHLATTIARMSSSGTTGSADNGAASAQTGKEEQQPQQPLALPWQDTATQPSAPVNIEVGGAAVQLDHLGPMVINTDGTVSRIANWAEMSEFERKATMRVIAKRNRERREVLQQQQELQGQHQE